jgi:hypothetical protein
MPRKCGGAVEALNLAVALHRSPCGFSVDDRMIRSGGPKFRFGAGFGDFHSGFGS